MELQDVWKQLEAGPLQSPVNGSVTIVKHSRHPVQKLKSAYLRTTAMAVIFLLGFVALLFFFPQPWVKVSLVLVIISYVFFSVINFRMYRQIKADLPMDHSLKEVLQQTHSFISNNILFQERAALLIYPIALVTGFLMGGAMGGRDLEALFEKPVTAWLLGGFIVVMTPACFYLSRWLYHISYGVCLRELAEKIKELENPT